MTGPYTIRTITTDDQLSGFSVDHCCFGDRPAALVLAYISPYADFVALTMALQEMAGVTPVVAVCTAGELCASAHADNLYLPAGEAWTSAVIQVFPPDLLQAVHIASVPLPNADIRNGSFTMQPEQRIALLTSQLQELRVPFDIDAKDTVALTFIDGLSSCENYLMEAVYRSHAFPCLFIGGSSGGKLDFLRSYLFDGQEVLEDHAVFVFLKLAPNRSYSAFKTQNFNRTMHSFVVTAAETDRRMVSHVAPAGGGPSAPMAQSVAHAMRVPTTQLMEQFKTHTFAIEIGGELYVRSVSGINTTTGAISFYCDINPGDTLLLLQATDFAAHTNADLANFLAQRPPLLGAILNDCILRRLNNEVDNQTIASPWPVAVAGFSTFGEIFGINVNQTLSALVFFATTAETATDPFIRQFPAHYAQYCSYFNLRRAQQLSTGSAQPQQIFEDMTDGIITINDKGEILSVNPAAERIFQYTATELVGTKVNQLMPATYAREHDGYLQHYVTTGESRITETGRDVTGRRKDGSEFPMHISVSKVKEQGENRFIGICRDITAQKAREDALRSSRDEATQASLTKSTFLAHMSHELRTPLNGLLGMAQLLLDTPLRPEQQELADNVMASGTNLLDIVNDILDLSKIEAGGMQLETIGFDPNATVEQVIKVLRPLALQKDLKLAVEIPEKLPLVIGDPTRVRQILTNLVGNAIKYTPKGSVTLRLGTEAKADGRIRLQCAVEDTGIGIAEDKLASIFDSFTQAETSTTRTYGGTGLGLAITRKLVEMMGGDISVTSKVGTGSCFRCSLPFNVTESLYEARFQRRTNDVQGTIAPADARILIAEDIAINAMLLTKLLERQGIRHITVVTNGRAAVEAFTPGKWDLIFMDCFMPEMDGYQATMQIRTKEAAALPLTIEPVPIIATTANAMMGDQEKCLRHGMNYYLSKPYRLEDILQMLKIRVRL